MGIVNELDTLNHNGEPAPVPLNGDEKSDAAAETVVQTAKRTRKKAAAPKTARKTARSKKRARAALREQFDASPTLDELPDAQAELDANPELQKHNQQLGQELLHEIEMTIKRLMRLSPAYKTSLAVPSDVQAVIGDNIEAAAASAGGASILKRFQKLLPGEMIDTDTLKGMWTMLKFTGEYQVDVFKRRLKGDYDTDEWGMDQEFIDAIRPLLDFMYNKYWRVSMTGLENIPDDGRALLVSNHSGQLPFDGAMIGSGILQHHPASRMMRALYANWFPTLPFVSDLLTKTGQVMANDENAERLLTQDHLVAVFPEGYKGVGKLYKDRYHLARFGRGGFARIALKTKTPLIPVAVVGAEETYISLYKSQTMAKLIGFPYFPISPTFPLLGPLGLIPLPTKWYIDIGEPIRTDEYPDDSENNLMLISQLTDQTRDTVQNMINDRLRQRKSIFLG
ncbi:MAG: glycerol acyltransferase [Chloroflexota bacterium]|nr:MAG: glycerol acyltransferase [Chloroflexota bacterium]